MHQYCDVDDTELQKKVKGLNKAIPGMFVFLEYDSVEPTNNPAEQALRYAVVFRKISGQIKGGERAMRRMSICVQTWRAQGLSVMNEYEFTSSGILCTNHINCRDQLCVNLDTGELIHERGCCQNAIIIEKLGCILSYYVIKTRELIRKMSPLYPYTASTIA